MKPKEPTVEEWRDISDYKGLYQVSSMGRVRSLDRVIHTSNGRSIRRKGMILSLPKRPSGYPSVCLWKDNASTGFDVHRLVAMAFIGNPENKREVNHIDGCKWNNLVENLEWNTSAENRQHAFKNNLLDPSRCWKGTVIVFDLEGNEVDRLKSRAEILEKGYSDKCIYAVLSGRKNTHKGFTYKREIKCA